LASRGANAGLLAARCHGRGASAPRSWPAAEDELRACGDYEVSYTRSVRVHSRPTWLLVDHRVANRVRSDGYSVDSTIALEQHEGTEVYLPAHTQARSVSADRFGLLPVTTAEQAATPARS
jgi:hypothetical protein